MSAVHLVKTGLMGVVGRYRSSDFTVFPRDTSVICRTARGLEAGHVLCALDGDGQNDAAVVDGQLLRRISPDDQMILDRLNKFRDRAYTACSQLLDEQSINAVLVDVEHLFDGESVYFYFMGAIDPRLETLTASLAATYERKVKFKQFAETLASGCGPNCGTRDCSTEGCATCAAGGGCAAKAAMR